MDTDQAFPFDDAEVIDENLLDLELLPFFGYAETDATINTFPHEKHAKKYELGMVELSPRSSSIVINALHKAISS
jgi:hypothetical protein